MTHVSNKGPRELRSRAEAKAAAGGGTAADLAQKDPIALIHELSVHKIELEIQNEELRSTQAHADELSRRFQDLYNFAPVCYFTLDAGGKITEANIAASIYLGVATKDLIGTSFASYVRQSSLKAYSDFIAHVMAAADRQRCELQLTRGRTQKGHAIVEAVAANPGEWGEQGKELRIALIDISEQHRAEEALRKLNDELETRVLERTAELRERDRMLLLQSRQAAMGEMIGNIAHQWRQPLNALGLMVQALLFMDERGNMGREVLENTVKSAMETITNMSATIDDFRNYFRPDREKVPFHLESAVARSLGLIGESFKSRQIAVDVVKDNDPLVTGFPNEFSQALLNVLLNAKDVFEERNVEEPRIVICVTEEGGRGVVTITDNGGGIEEDIIDKIFEPYFTTKSPDRGTGVGLFMAKSIIEKNMGGSLTVRNTGLGAEFRMVMARIT